MEGPRRTILSKTGKERVLPYAQGGNFQGWVQRPTVRHQNSVFPGWWGLERQTAGFINKSCCQPCPGLPMGSQASFPACSVHPLPFPAFILHLLRLLTYHSSQSQLDINHRSSSHNASLVPSVLLVPPEDERWWSQITFPKGKRWHTMSDQEL